MNRKDRRAARKSGDTAVSPTAATLAQAFRAHQAGHRSEAERLYRDVLAIEPRHAPALHLLGALMHQGGRSDEAVALIRQAIAIEPRNADYRYNLGLILLQSNRLDDAIDNLRAAVDLKSNHADAHFELGNAYARAALWSDAAGAFRRVIALRPGDHSAQNNLALVLREQGALEEAAALWERMLKSAPSFALGHMNLGLAYQAMGRIADAEAKLRETVKLQPELAEAHYNLASLLIEQDKSPEALKSAQRVFERRDTSDDRRLFIHCLTAGSQIPLDPDLEPLLYRALSEDWADPQSLYGVYRSYLTIQPAVDGALKRAETEQPDPLPLVQLFGDDGPHHIGDSRLLREMLAAMPVSDAGLERLVVRARFALLDAVRRQGEADSLPENLIRLSCAIARQCFVNQYVFDETPEERSIVDPLLNRIEAALRGGRPVAPEAVAIVAAYRPLQETPLAGLLSPGVAHPALAPVLKQQIEEPLAEQTLRGAIAKITLIGDEIAGTIGEQFEQHPFPRWVRTSRLGAPVPIDRFLQDAFPHAALQPLDHAGAIEMLVAGCGTGLDAITAAQRIAARDILAVDLSLASLAFAERQTRALGLANIRYAQADIANLPSPGRSFDAIVCAGVLHHLADPWEGWRALLSMLRSRGVMRIGLHSALGRRDIAQAQDFVRSGNYQPDREGMRACRRNIMRLPAGSPQRSAIGFPDFYTASGCRNLLFNARECRVTIPEIASFIEANGLGFLGFDLSRRSLEQFRGAFPSDGALSDLASWHQFETRHPDTFRGLYDFWVQKS